MGQSPSNESEPSTTGPPDRLALRFFDEQFNKRPDDEGLKANAREAFVITFKRFGIRDEEDAELLADAFLATQAGATPTQKGMVRDGLEEAWAILSGRTKTGPTAKRSRARQNGHQPPREPRIYWRYAPVPLAIVDDRNLSGVAVKVAAIIARSVNLGVWNTDLYAKLTYAELAEKAGVSRATAARALDELKGAGHICIESLTRGGCRITFQQSHP
jgi:hypothetical protein